MTLNPHWLSGFVDGEGCFWVGIVNVTGTPTVRNPEGLITKQVQVRFTINQHVSSIKVLYAIKRYFKCGRVTANKGKRAMETSPVYDYRVNNKDHLMENIIPFFEKYSLQTAKRQDFLFFRKFVTRLSEEQHMTTSPETGRAIWNSTVVEGWEKEINAFKAKRKWSIEKTNIETPDEARTKVLSSDVCSISEEKG